MKKYALILACLAWSLGPTAIGQTAAGGGAGGATGGGAAAGSAVSPAAAGQAGSAVGSGASGTLTPGQATPRIGTPPGLQRPLPGVRAGQQPGTPATPGNPAIGPGTGVNPGTGAIGGVGPGVGGTGGTGVGAVQPGGGLPGTGATGNLQPQTGTTADVQTGVTGTRGTATPGTGAALGTAEDLALAQQVRAQLLSRGTGGAATAPGVANNPAQVRAQGLGVLTPESLANVQITANNGVVTLGGNVTSEAQRRLLEARIRQMPGVHTLVNNLTIAGASGQPVNRGQGAGLGTRTGVGTGQSAPGTINEVVNPNNNSRQATPTTPAPR